jgi:tetratricopeptide (TPR) repeat protein
MGKNLERYHSPFFSFVWSLILITHFFFFGCMSHQKGKPDSHRYGEKGKNYELLSSREKADYAYTQAEAYSQDGKPKKAVEYFREAVLHDPQSLSLKVRLSMELLRVGAMRESLELLDSVLKENPQFVKALILKANLLGALKNNTEAIKILEMVTLLEPENTEVILPLGFLYTEEKQYDLACDSFRRLIQNKSYPTPELGYYYLGRVQEEKGDPQSLKNATESYLKALQMKPKYIDALMGVVALYIQQKQPQKAELLLEKWQAEEGVHLRVAETLANLYLLSDQPEKALAQLRIVESFNPQSSDIKMRLALILINQKQYQEATSFLEEILKETPDSDRVRFSLGAVYLELQEEDKALSHLIQVPYYSSYYTDSVVQCVQILKRQKKLTEAQKLLTQALEKKEEEVQFAILYAMILNEQRLYEENQKFLSQMLKVFPQSTVLLFLNGMNSDFLQDKAQALSWMEKVLDQDPEHALALNYIAYSYAEEKKELDMAMDLAQRALQKDPDNAYIYDTIGWIYYQKGQYQKALPWLEKAFNGAYQEGVIIAHLADVYVKLGLFSKAQAMYGLAWESSDDDLFRQSVQEKRQALNQNSLHGPPHNSSHGSSQNTSQNHKNETDPRNKRIPAATSSVSSSVKEDSL